jgi:hypothetical protein
MENTPPTPAVRPTKTHETEPFKRTQDFYERLRLDGKAGSVDPHNLRKSTKLPGYVQTRTKPSSLERELDVLTETELHAKLLGVLSAKVKTHDTERAEMKEQIDILIDLQTRLSTNSERDMRPPSENGMIQTDQTRVSVQDIRDQVHPATPVQAEKQAMHHIYHSSQGMHSTSGVHPSLLPFGWNHQQPNQAWGGQPQGISPMQQRQPITPAGFWSAPDGTITADDLSSVHTKCDAKTLARQVYPALLSGRIAKTRESMMGRRNVMTELKQVLGLNNATLKQAKRHKTFAAAYKREPKAASISLVKWRLLFKALLLQVDAQVAFTNHLSNVIKKEHASIEERNLDLLGLHDIFMVSAMAQASIFDVTHGSDKEAQRSIKVLKSVWMDKTVENRDTRPHELQYVSQEQMQRAILSQLAGPSLCRQMLDDTDNAPN